MFLSNDYDKVNGMKITKFGHSCLLIEEQGVRILLDPGDFSSGQDSLQNINIILVTHEHPDHLSISSLKSVLANNPQAKVITTSAVGLLLSKEDIAFSVVEDGQEVNERGVRVQGVGKDHALLHDSIPCIHNTGYLIAERFFYPGDAFTRPPASVDILALPVAAPWMRLSETIDYAIALKPKVCFPVHDGILKTPGAAHRLPQQILEQHGIPFTVLELEKEYDF